MLARSFLLTRLLIKGGDFSMSQLSSKKKKLGLTGKIASKAMKVLLFILIFANIAVMSFFMGMSQGRAAAAGGSAAQSIASIFVVNLMFIVFMGFMTVIPILYHSNNNEQLLCMPFKPAEILTARFIQIIYSQYISTALIILPMFAGFGVGNARGVSYYFAAFIYYVLSVPIIMAPVTIFFILLLRYTRLFRDKDKFTVFVSILGMVFGIGIGIFISMQNAKSEDSGLPFHNFSLGNNISRFNPLIFGSDFAVRFIDKSSSLEGWGFGALYLLVFLAWMLLLISAGRISYLKGLHAMQSSPGRKVVRKSRVDGKNKVSSPFLAMVKKEWLQLLRTPAYFTNNVLAALIIPVIFILPSYFIFNEKVPGGIAGLRSYVSQLMDAPGSVNYIWPIIIMISLGLRFFFVGSNAIASGAISREGKNAYLMSLYPYPFHKQILAKFSLAYLFSIIVFAVFTLAIWIISGLPAMLYVLVLLISLPASAFSNMLGLYSDMLKPKLDWETEMQAAKQNLNALVEIFGSMILGALYCFLLWLLWSKLQLSFWLFYAAAFVLILLFDLLLVFLIKAGIRSCKRKIAEA